MRVLKIIATVLIPLQFGLLAYFPTAEGIQTAWYADLVKPSFYPASTLYVPVWTILYILMGISLWLAWQHGVNKANRLSIIVFFVQLLLNSTWSLLFFGLHNPFYALLDMVILLIFIALTIFMFYKFSRPAALLLLPYILWVSYEAILNYFIVILN
ncbi:MAG: benzodiazepine receptor TspO [Bacteroidetes bacterium]|jgi:tryptophan-rich sensory protein|nr:benzodiazepine receptor TspO [Bacteroidota bacterium]